MHEYTAVISSDAREIIAPAECDFDFLMLPPDMMLDIPVRCHADMILFTVGSKAILHESYIQAYPYIPETLASRCSLEIVTTAVPRGSVYPLDVSLNVLVCGNIALSLKRYTAPEVLLSLEEYGIEHRNIRQGYAACSTLTVNGCIITADPAVSRASREYGIDTLDITKGHIYLDGYNEGFIGGASGVCGNTVYFLGNIYTHPDAKKIREFLASHGSDIVCLGDGPLVDKGGIRFLKNSPLQL